MHPSKFKDLVLVVIPVSDGKNSAFYYVLAELVARELAYF